MKLLALDIETYPGLAFEWSPFDTNPTPHERWISPSGVLCFAAKWYGERGTMFYSRWEDGDREVAQAARDLLDEADAVLHYNGKRFDIPRLQGAIVLHQLDAPSPYKQIDLYPVVKRQFGFDYSKLGFVAPLLGIGKKVDNVSFQTWVGCLAGDKKAQRRMERYNRRDVDLLPKVYERVLPFIPNHPNRNLFRDPDRPEGCPSCGGSVQRWGVYVTTTGKYQRYRCSSCARTCRGAKRLSGVDLRPVSAN